MKIHTQVIDKIEDVRFNDVVAWEGDIYVTTGDKNPEGDEIMMDTCDWFEFNECTVVRLTVGSE